MAELLLQSDMKHDGERVQQVHSLIEEAKQYILSDYARLREFAQKIHQQSEEIGYYYGVAYAEYYIGRSLFIQADYGKALAHSQTALLLFEQAHEIAGVARSLRQIGGIYRAWNQFDTALQHYRREESIYHNPQYYDEEGMAGVLMEIATVYMMISQYDIALTYYQQALDCVKEFNDDVRLAKILANVATLYILLGKYDIAADYQERALALYQKMNNKESVTQLLVNMGWRCLQQNQFAKVVEYGNLALEVCEELGNKRFKAMVLLNIASAYMGLEQYDEAHPLLQLSYNLAWAVHDKRTCGAIQHTLGKFFLEQKHYEQALSSLSQALELVRGIGLKHEEYQMYHLLARVEEEQGHIAESLGYYKEYIRLKEEVLDERRSQAIGEMQMRFNVEQAEAEKEIYRLKNVEMAGMLKKVEALNTHLEEMNEEKDNMLKIVAHDMKNPLTIIGLTITLAMSRLEQMTQEEVREQLKTIDKTAERLNSIVSRLSDMSIIESGKMTIQQVEVNLNESVQNCIAMYRDRMREKDIELESEFSAEGVWLYTDRNLLDEVIDNILSNAVKYSFRGKTVRVHTWVQGDRGNIAIADGGPGIREEDREKLFKKFSRLRSRPTGGEGATGLGLWIVKKLVEKMEGSIACESNVGEGATFTVTFPLATRLLSKTSTTA